MAAKNRRNWACLSVGTTLMFAITCGLGVRPAHAEVTDVTGMDYVLPTSEVVAATDSQDKAAAETQSKEGMIDFCSVTYDGNDAVYVELKKGDRKIASHMYYPLTEDGQDVTETRVGVLSLGIPSFDPSAAYTIGVYADHNQKNLLFSGEVKPVYADTGDKVQLIAVRTIAKDEEGRKFSAPNIITMDGAAYARKDKQPSNTDPLTYLYEITDGTSVDATVTYVDEEGNELQSVKVATLAAGQSEEYQIPATIIVEKDGETSVWRTLSYTGKVTLSLPGQSEYTITCKPLLAPNGSEIKSVGNYYVAKIKLVDESGATLGSDSLNVTSRYLYTPPTRLHVNSSGQVNDYEIAKDNADLSEGNVLDLDPAKDGVTTGSKTFEILYTKVADDAPRTWTVVIENGSADPKDKNRVIDTKTYTVEPGDTATFKPEASITVGTTVYVPVASTKDEYTYTHGQVAKDGEQSVYPKLTVYYVPDGYVEPEPYEITINYVNIANSKVIESHSLTSRPEDRDNLEITSPEKFTKDGVEYVRLNGQEQSIWHSFYSSARKYNIYYRDINDDLHADTTISRVEVEYEDGETTTTNGGTNTIDDGTNYTDGGTNYVDGGTTTTNGGTTTNNGGTTVNNGGTTANEGGTNYVDGGTTYNDGATSYTDGGTGRTGVDGGTTTVPSGMTDGGTTTTMTDGGVGGAGTSTGATGAGNADAQRASVPTTSEGLTVINDGDGNATMTDSSGRDTNTMRIDDDTTPLAGPSSSTNAAADQASSKVNTGAVVGAITVLGAALAAWLFWFFKRRRENEDAEETPEAEA